MNPKRRNEGGINEGAYEHSQLFPGGEFDLWFPATDRLGTAKLSQLVNECRTIFKVTRRTARFRLRDRQLENSCEAPSASVDWLNYLGRVRRHNGRSKSLERQGKPGGACDGRACRPL